MAFGFCISLALFLSVWSAVRCDGVPNGVHMECRDRYFMIAVNLSFVGTDYYFEAVDETGVYPITEDYGDSHGYSIVVVPQIDQMELRASYFSSHTDNEDDEVFTFTFNLVAVRDNKEVSYALNKTCSPSLPWSPREVTCEVNYMEVSVRSDVACPTATRGIAWDAAVQTAYAAALTDWQVMFHNEGLDPRPMSLGEAHKLGYTFELTDGRLAFRTPYGQPDSFSTEVNGVPVEVVHATLFSRQGWLVLLVDLVAACSMDEGSYDDSGYMVWMTPMVLHLLVSSVDETQINVGVNGKLVEQAVIDEQGYMIETDNTTAKISVPYDAEGGFRKSLVSDGLYEFYVFDLYLEQISMDDDQINTRFRYHRTLSTPLLPLAVFTENRTVAQEQMFTVYLGELPKDVELAAINLNGHEVAAPITNTSSYTITTVPAPLGIPSHGYTLTVPCGDPLVVHEFSGDRTTMQHKLDINYTLTVLPENEPFYHWTSVMVLADISPPVFDAVCSESGISFTLDHKPFDYMWEISVGSAPLTAELAAQHGYTMSNDSQSLQLFAPLFAPGYTYENITLKRFMGTFEILVRDQETSEVQSSAVKSCSFPTSELIMCSTDGKMTVVADFAHAVSSGHSTRIHLVDRFCVPIEMDNTRALFSFPLNSCGSTVKLNKDSVTYENEIFFNEAWASPDSSSAHSVTVSCKYALAGLYRLFSVYRFESDTAGVGQMTSSAHSTQGLLSPTMQPTTTLQRVSTRRSRKPGYGPHQYISVSSFLQNTFKKGTRGSSS